MDEAHLHEAMINPRRDSRNDLKKHGDHPCEAEEDIPPHVI